MSTSSLLLAAGPPGTQGLNTVIDYVAWVAFALSLLGFVVAAASMVTSHRSANGTGS